MRLPSGEKAALRTPAPCMPPQWPRRTLIVVPVATSQIRAVSSCEAVTTRAPSGEKAALLTPRSWPLRTLIVLPVVTSQIRAVLSDDAVTTRVPSGEKAAELTSPSWPLKDRDRRARGDVPNPRRLIVRGRDDARAVRREGGEIDPFIMPTEDRDRRARGDVPNPRRLVV